MLRLASSSSLSIASGHNRHYSPRVEDFLAVTEAQDPVGRVVWRAFWGSRLVVFFAGVVAAAQFGNQPVASVYDPDGLTAPFGYFGNLLVSPFARWDSAWYLAVAKWGYGPQTSGRPMSPSGGLPRTNFFPLYPGLIRVFGWVVRSDLIAGVLISLVAFAVALTVLYKLVRLDYSAEVAEVTVLLVAFCPMAFYFSAVYTESLFLALSLGSIYAARRGRWLYAGLAGGLAAATHGQGVVLIVPLLMLVPWQRRAGSLRVQLPLAALWLALVPAGLLAYLGYLGVKYHNALAPFRTQSIFWNHKQSWPLHGVWKGAVAAWHGVEQLVQGPTPPYRIPFFAGGPSFSAMQDIYLFAFLVLVVIAFIGGLRRLPRAYSAYAFFLLVPPLSAPNPLSPLESIPRYAMVAFPLFIWAADVVVRRRLTVHAVAIGAVLLGLFTAEFATWVWVG
jgi:hypothetical protein